MKAWVVQRYGSLEDLVLEEVPEPQSTSGTVKVKVLKAGLNFADGINVRGKYQVKWQPPFILGSEIAGIVVEAGSQAGVQPGQMVLAQVPFGAYAEYCVVDPARLIGLPPDIDPVQAAALPVSYTTAYLALKNIAHLQPNQTIVIHAAAGGVGLAAVQLARHVGARVIGIAGSEEKCEIVAENGADFTVNYRMEAWAERVRDLVPGGVNVVLDPVGGDTTLQSLSVMAWGGRLLLVGFASGSPALIPANKLLVRAISAIGVFWDFDRDVEGTRRMQAELADFLAGGRIRPHVAATLAFEDMKSGIAMLESGTTVGKIILDVARA